MNHDMHIHNIYEYINHSLPFVLFACGGGLVSFLYFHKENKSVWMFITQISLAGFIGGVVVHGFICTLDFELSWKVSVISLSGFFGRSLVPVLEKLLKMIMVKYLKINTDNDNKT